MRTEKVLGVCLLFSCHILLKHILLIFTTYWIMSQTLVALFIADSTPFHNLYTTGLDVFKSLTKIASEAMAN